MLQIYGKISDYARNRTENQVVRFLFCIIYCGYDVFRTCADAIFPTPDTQSGTDVVACVAALMRTERTLIHRIGNPGDRPHLPVVGVAAELEVYASLFCQLQVVGLVVQQYGVFLHVGLLDQCRNIGSALVGTVVSSYDAQVAYDH